jgi:hypothetical protein
MQVNVQLRRQMIESALTRHPQAVVSATIGLWETLTPELVSIIGEGGFKPLYSRSVRLACQQYPWMAHDAQTLRAHERFAQLQACLQAQELPLAHKASMALFTIFLDMLASLIGEALTTHLLQSAWSQETVQTPAKDFPK